MLRNPRGNLGYLIAGAGGLLTILFLFTGWESGGGVSLSAWQIFGTVDILLCALGILVTATAAVRVFALGGPAWLREEILLYGGVVATTITGVFLLENDHLGFGNVLSLLAALAILGGAILVRRPELAQRVASAADSIGSGTAGAAASPAIGGTPPAPTATTTAGAAPAAQPAAAPAGAAATDPSQPQSASGPPSAGAEPAAQPAAAAESGGPPAGWYPDPQGQARLRYWDGSAWTGQTSA